MVVSAARSSYRLTTYFLLVLVRLAWVSKGFCRHIRQTHTGRAQSTESSMGTADLAIVKPAR